MYWKLGKIGACGSSLPICKGCGKVLWQYMFAKRKSENSRRANPPQANKAAPTKHLTHTAQWRCMNCGQYVFVVIDCDPPDVCQYCNDMTTWQLTKH